MSLHVGNVTQESEIAFPPYLRNAMKQVFSNCVRVVLTQGVHKITSDFQNGTENKCGVLRISHPHQSIESLKTFFQMT
jgi:hypothetical protein